MTPSHGWERLINLARALKATTGACSICLTLLLRRWAVIGDASLCSAPVSKQESTFRHLLWNPQQGAQQVGILESRPWSMSIPFWVLLQWLLKMQAEIVLLPLLSPTWRWQCQDEESHCFTGHRQNIKEVPPCPFTHTWYFTESNFRERFSVLRQPKPVPSAREALQQPELPAMLIPMFHTLPRGKKVFPYTATFYFLFFLLWLICLLGNHSIINFIEHDRHT